MVESCRPQAPADRLVEFLGALPLDDIPREPGVGLFVASADAVDTATFLRYLARYRSLPERVVFVTTCVDDVPTLPASRRARLADLGGSRFLATIHYGFDDRPDVPAALATLPGRDLDLDGPATRYYVARDGPSHASLAGMPAWKRGLFMLLSKVCATPAEYFCLPGHRVVEIAADTPTRRRPFVASTTGAAQFRR